MHRRRFIQREFGLLELNATTGKDVHITLREFKSFSDCPSYEAVSWCWGVATAVGGLYVDSYDIDIDVPGVCLAMLQDLRQQERSRHLWLDSICIIQTDPIERAQRVSLMGHIYRTASQVIAYTGAEDACSIVVLNRSNKTWPKELSQNGLRHFMQRPWFGHSWVIQEVLLAKQIVLQAGLLTAPWEAFEDKHQSLGLSGRTSLITLGTQRRDLVELRTWPKEVNKSCKRTI